jgi:diguanylate cyclase (GGDEF)-like protein
MADSGTPTALATHLIQLDIDGFKSLNDRHGHLHGDQTLIELAGALNEGLRKYLAQHVSGGEGSLRRKPVVARVGGDRFVVGTPHKFGPELSCYLLEAVADLPVDLTVSIGETSGDVTSKPELWALVATAESNLSRNKIASRNIHRSTDARGDSQL